MQCPSSVPTYVRPYIGVYLYTLLTRQFGFIVSQFYATLQMLHVTVLNCDVSEM